MNNVITNYPTASLVTELNALLRLTNSDATIARSRKVQAQNERVERELTRRAEQAEQHSRDISEAIRGLDGLPDMIGAAFGRFGGMAKLAIEQGQTLTEALLGDLALAHQLRDRARLVRLLADTAEERTVARLAERLEKAHTSTVEWLESRLAEIASGAPVAIKPTTAQTVIGYGQRLAYLPTRQMGEVANRSVATLEEWKNRASDVFGRNAERARQSAEAANDIWTASRDASLEKAEELATEQRAKETAKAVHSVRRDLGALNPEELPIKSFDTLNAGVAVNRIRRLSAIEEVQAVLAYEMAHKARKGVTAAAETRLQDLAVAS